MALARCLVVVVAILLGGKELLCEAVPLRLAGNRGLLEELEREQARANLLIVLVRLNMYLVSDVVGVIPYSGDIMVDASNSSSSRTSEL
jgi:hypothetical protein